ncbi:flippase-like domain-containing protein [Actinotalea sp.]|uniref:flippase-like domain-containing protein n=1 Tax=Actinotalea sp. TaxID=1872145 RepID=UPI0035669070
MSSTTAVTIVDAPRMRVHSGEDLLSAILSALGVAAVLLLAVVAHGTTAGVVEDAQVLDTVLSRVLVLPVALIAAVVLVTIPVGLVVELLVRRAGRLVLESLAGAGLAAGLATAVLAVIDLVGSDALTSGLSVLGAAGPTVTVPVAWAAVAGLLTVAGPRTTRRSVGWAWNTVAVVLLLLLLAGRVSLLGAAAAMLLGRAAGALVRYASGVRSERAYGSELVAGIRRAGIDPVVVERSGGDDGVHRDYELRTADGRRLGLVVLDGDRQVLGAVTRLWRALRLRGIEGRAYVSLRQAAERIALLSHAARIAGVRTPAVLAVTAAQDSMLLVTELLPDAVEEDSAAPDDAVLADAWSQLLRAHRVGVTHRALGSGTVQVRSGQVWLTGWDSGDVASADLARRIDLAQLLTALALRVGPERALASATAALPEEDLVALAALLQPVVLPASTREALKARREVLPALREALATRLPEADLEPERLSRFGLGTLVTVVLPVLAVILVLTRVNLDEVLAALESSDWRWALASFGLGLATFYGAALAVRGFSPVKVPMGVVTLVHGAAAFVAIAAPSGLGVGALNLRMLTRRGVATSLALATVALVQVSQVVVTVLLLVGLSLVSGTDEASSFVPGSATWIVLGAVALLIAVAMLVPPVRRWALGRTVPVLRQTWPRLLEVLGQPGRMAVALVGNLLLSVGWVLAFQASLLAFGVQLSLVQVAIIYFAGNTAGGAVPTPGGIGGIEVALIALLTSAGVNPGVAASAVTVFRLATYWLQIPLGWACMRVLRRMGEL